MKRSVMKRWSARRVLCAALFGCALLASPSGQETGQTIRVIDPSEQDFFSKAIDYRGIPIKAQCK
jgi:hypothetical protein